MAQDAADQAPEEAERAGEAAAEGAAGAAQRRAEVPQGEAEAPQPKARPVARAEARAEAKAQPRPEPEKRTVLPSKPQAAKRGRPPEVHVWPNLVQIEMVAALAYILMLSILSMFVDAPFRNLANPELTPNPSKAPWYFLGLQELLLHMHPALAGVIVPGLVLVGLAIVPYFDTQRKGTGIWFSTPNGLPIFLFSSLYTFIWELGLVLVDEFLVVGASQRGIAALLRSLGVHAAIAEITVPMFFMVFIPWSMVVICKRRWQADTREVMLSLFAFFVTSFTLLTFLGTAFRGHSMRLFWPWDPEGAFVPPVE